MMGRTHAEYDKDTYDHPSGDTEVVGGMEPNFDLAPNLRQEEWRRNCTIRSDAPPSSESITSSLVGREVKALGKTLNETVIPRKVLE